MQTNFAEAARTKEKVDHAWSIATRREASISHHWIQMGTNQKAPPFVYPADRCWMRPTADINIKETKKKMFVGKRSQA
jgi:hypothetical protein